MAKFYSFGGIFFQNIVNQSDLEAHIWESLNSLDEMYCNFEGDGCNF